MSHTDGGTFIALRIPTTCLLMNKMKFLKKTVNGVQIPGTLLFATLTIVGLGLNQSYGQGEADPVRFSTYNASLNRSSDGRLVTDLSDADDSQAKRVAEIIQRVNPDVLLINEFDFVVNNEAVDLFRTNYLEMTQAAGVSTITFPYSFVAESNTGISSGFDLNNNGTAVTTPGSFSYADDSFGFGVFPGQYGMVLYSKYPIVVEDIRTFQKFLWKDMPNALLPDDSGTPEAGDYYSTEELEVFRLSSKSHWDVPIEIDGQVVHVLVSHPTPPVFDDDEIDHNGRRNHDEIRFWADYVTPGADDYIYDDEGAIEGLGEDKRFVIMGDQNADPNDGESTGDPIQLLLDNSNIDTSIEPTSLGGTQAALSQGGVNDSHTGPSALDTADFSDNSNDSPGNLRADYVLPSVFGFSIIEAGVFWPLSSEGTFSLISASDHRLVYVDLESVPPDPVPDVLGGLPIDGFPGWHGSAWYKNYNNEMWPWIYHDEHGWQWVDDGSTIDIIFLWDLGLGEWIFLNEQTYRWLYLFSQNFGWIFTFENNTAGSRFFQRFDDGSIFSIPPG